MVVVTGDMREEGGYMFSQERLRVVQMRRHHLAPETKGRDKQDIITVLRDVGGLSWTAPLYHRMACWKREWLSELQWQDKRIVEGRFFGSSLQYVPTDELPVYYRALTPKLELNPNDRLILHRLDLSLKIVRAGWAETRGWGQPLWEAFEREVGS